MEMILSRLLSQALHCYHNRTALRVGDQTWTYRQLDQLSDALAAGLQDRGVSAGDCVALYLRNCAEYVIADLALLKLGAIKVPLNEYQSQLDVLYILENTGANTMIAHQSLLSKLDEKFVTERTFPLLVCVADEEFGECELPHLDWGELQTTRDFSRGTCAATDTALIAYTGGTTGRPKGVVHTQSSLAVNLFAHIVAGEISASDVMMLMTPLPHSAGYHMQACLLQGGQVILKDHFDPARFYVDIERYLVTWTFLVPTMIYRLLDHPDADGHDHSSLRTIVYGAAPMSTTRLEQAIKRFGYAFIQLYGQTECPNFISALTKQDHRNPGLHGSCGKAVPFVELATTGEGHTGIGEVVVRSPYLLKEYYHNAEATAESIRDGWLQTGDVGFIDDDGYLFLKDRAKDMIISGGMNVYSNEVEQTLKKHPSVADAAVVGLPDEDWGERVHAVVIRRNDVDAEELLDLCREDLSRYKVPKSIEFRHELPLTAYGKVDKKALRKNST